MKCPKCGNDLEWAGFSRELSTKGKNKGTYMEKEFYKKCNCNKDKNDNNKKG